MASTSRKPRTFDPAIDHEGRYLVALVNGDRENVVKIDMRDTPTITAYLNAVILDMKGSPTLNVSVHAPGMAMKWLREDAIDELTRCGFITAGDADVLLETAGWSGTLSAELQDEPGEQLLNEKGYSLMVDDSNVRTFAKTGIQFRQNSKGEWYRKDIKAGTPVYIGTTPDLIDFFS